MNQLTFKLNTYIATLIVTVVGAGASLIIIHVANSTSRLATNNQIIFTELRIPTP